MLDNLFTKEHFTHTYVSINNTSTKDYGISTINYLRLLRTPYCYLSTNKNGAAVSVFSLILTQPLLKRSSEETSEEEKVFFNNF